MTTNESRPAVAADIVTMGELADLLQFHPSMEFHASTIYRLLRRGELRAFKVGSRWAFSREAIDRVIQLEARHHPLRRWAGTSNFSA
ncbi:MAG: helix-turn-helix domain-containing protein [Deltaproteobacteria bacterium]|nr:helix-turn-helix domain-containing protein [Deltaproteobacteria bacterium]